MISLKHIKLLLVLTLLPFKVWADTSVGTPNGQFSVNETGAAVYSVPLELFPSGTGFDPQIGIAYNSQLSGYGNVGYGVNITGFSSITRAAKDLFHDKKVEKIKYCKGDTYMLDGKRLILKSGSYGYDNATYTIEGDPYVTVTQKGDDNHSTTTFTCTDANGVTYEYRETLLVPIGDSNRTIAWYLSKATNKYGDCIEYKYMEDCKVIYPSEITYGRNGEKHKVCFIYAALTKPQKLTFEGGWVGYNNRRLTRITSYNGNSVYRMYDFSYNTSSDASLRKFDRLIAINVSNGRNESMKPISLNWNYLKGASINRKSVAILDDLENKYHEQTKYFLSADINGDGFSDFIRFSICGENEKGPLPVITYSISTIDKTSGTVTYKEKVRDNIYIFLNNAYVFGGNVFGFLDEDNCADLIFPVSVNSGESNFKDVVVFNVFWGNEISTKDKADFDCISYDLKSGHETPLYQLFDLNGDGKSELIFIEKKKQSGYFYGNIDFISKDKSLKLNANGGFDITKTTQGNPVKFKYSQNKEIKKMFFADCNADGLQDLILLFADGHKIYFNNGGTNLSSVFTESNSKEVTSGTQLKDYWRMEQGDFNNDGLTDFVVIAAGESKLSFLCNNGNGTFSITGSADVDFSENTGTDRDDSYFTIRVVDFDKDGRSDVFVSKKHLIRADKWYETKWYKMDKTQVRLFRSEPLSSNVLSNDYRPVLWKNFDKAAEERDCAEANIFTGDFDGDGYLEIANYGSPLNSSSDNTFKENGKTHINVYSFSTDVALGNLASITNGFGKKTTVTYASGTNPSVYTAGNPDDCSYPVKTYTLPMTLVSKISETNGAANTQYVTYKYGDLRIHVKGRGMIGFTSMTVNNTTLCSKTETKVTGWNNNRYLPTSVLSTTTIGDKTSETLIKNNISSESTWNGNYFSYCKEKQSTDFDGHQTKTQYTFDLTKGVMTYEKNYYDGRTDMYKHTNYSGYELCAGKYLPKSVLYVQKHRDDSEIYKVRHNYTYKNGDVIKDEQISMYKDKTVTLTTTYTRDDYGNVLTELTSGNNVVAVKKIYEYDANHLRLIKSYTNPASAVITYKYDSWGNLIKKSDESYASNILSTTYTYDKWGSLIKTVNPDGTYTSVTTAWDTTPTNDGSTYGSVYKTVTSASAQAPVTVYYDSEGREVNSSTIGLKGVNITKVTHYDSKGNVAHVVNTTGKLETSSIMSYDAFGRLTLQKNSDGSSIKNSYKDRTVTTEEPTGTKTKTYDAWGNIREVNDASGIILTYHYNSNGQPSAISSNDNSSITFDFDAAGRRVKMVDPDAGTTTYKYAADGTLLSQTDARGVTTNYSYDKLGRLKTKTYVDKSGNKKTQTNEYFPSGKDINRLQSQTYDGYKRSFTYDNYGRVTSETRNMSIVASHCKDKRTSYKTIWTYDSNGQKKSATYPSFKSNAMTFDYSYDQYGYLSEIKHGDKSIYSVNGYDGLKLDVNTVAGVLSKEVDNDGFPKVYTLSGKDTQTFGYNKTTGNLTSRKWTHGVTTMLDESFKYGKLDRLEEVVGTQKMKMSYGSNGNILSKTGIGSYTYDKSKPHAVTSVSNDSKIITSNTVETEFALNGKISTISCTGAAYREYFYGPDDEKWKTYGWGPTQPGEKDVEHLYFGDYEEITEDGGGFTEYCFLENGIIFCRKTNSNTNSSSIGYYQAVTDNLGNILALYDQFGQEKFCAKYDAWGKQTVSTNKINFHYGYTGHEMLPDFDLIDMGGRLYDPNLGRFLSCDNFVQTTTNFQCFNRYSYCFNNPLRYTDPDGQNPVLIAIAVAGALNTLANWNNIHSFDQGLCYFGAGAICGFASMSGPIGVLGGSLALGGLNSIITQGYDHGWNNINWDAVGTSATWSATVSCLGMCMGPHISRFMENTVKVSEKISNPISREIVKDVTSGVIVGTTTGTIRSINDMSGSWSWESWRDNVVSDVTVSAISGVISGYERGSLEVRHSKVNWSEAPNDGALGLWENCKLQEGVEISRYGKLEGGRFVSPVGEPFPNRSLPLSNRDYKYRTFKVTKSFDVSVSIAAPCFGKPGGAVQYQFYSPIPTLIKGGYLKETTPIRYRIINWGFRW